jgi:hypothetical protein
MKALLLSAVLTLGFASHVLAGELDNESSVTNQQLQGTLVIRVDQRTNQAAALKTDAVVTTPSQAKALAAKGQFRTLPSSKVRTELDSDGGASSWYFYPQYSYGNSYYYNYTNWYGNWYAPCYSYNYNYYNNYNYYSYYYYSSYWR